MSLRTFCHRIIPYSRCFLENYKSQRNVALCRTIWSISGARKISELGSCEKISFISYHPRRLKHGKKRVKEDEDEDDEEDEFEEEPGSKIITGYMASLRADLVLKTGLGIARNKVETLFYESKIRVNGSKIHKKSQKVNVGDELDVLKGPSPINESMMLVSRVTVLGAKEHEDGDKLVVKMRRYKSLTIENEDLQQ